MGVFYVADIVAVLFVVVCRRIAMAVAIVVAMMAWRRW